MSEQEEATFTHGDISYKFSELDDYSQKCYQLIMKVTKEIEQLESDVAIKKAASIYLSKQILSNMDKQKDDEGR
jgi:adenine-specific DNA methylase|tara:strand:- start:104 stop:325 length:222 start_codon:yes stop_codon:yes gene_type:complete